MLLLHRVQVICLTTTAQVLAAPTGVKIHGKWPSHPNHKLETYQKYLSILTNATILDVDANGSTEVEA